MKGPVWKYLMEKELRIDSLGFNFMSNCVFSVYNEKIKKDKFVVFKKRKDSILCYKGKYITTKFRWLVFMWFSCLCVQWMIRNHRIKSTNVNNVIHLVFELSSAVELHLDLVIWLHFIWLHYINFILYNLKKKLISVDCNNSEILFNKLLA